MKLILSSFNTRGLVDSWLRGGELKLGEALPIEFPRDMVFFFVTTTRYEGGLYLHGYTFREKGYVDCDPVNSLRQCKFDI